MNNLEFLLEREGNWGLDTNFKLLIPKTKIYFCTKLL